MNAGKLYEIIIGGVMVYLGAMFVCIDCRLLPRHWKLREAGESMPLKKKHPFLFSMLGPIALLIGVTQILRQFDLLR